MLILSKGFAWHKKSCQKKVSKESRRIRWKWGTKTFRKLLNAWKFLVSSQFSQLFLQNFFRCSRKISICHIFSRKYFSFYVFFLPLFQCQNQTTLKLNKWREKQSRINWSLDSGKINLKNLFLMELPFSWRHKTVFQVESTRYSSLWIKNWLCYVFLANDKAAYFFKVSSEWKFFLFKYVWLRLWS